MACKRSWSPSVWFTHHTSPTDSRYMFVEFLGGSEGVASIWVLLRYLRCLCRQTLSMGFYGQEGQGNKNRKEYNKLGVTSLLGEQFTADYGGMSNGLRIETQPCEHVHQKWVSSTGLLSGSRPYWAPNMKKCPQPKLTNSESFLFFWMSTSSPVFLCEHFSMKLQVPQS